MLQGFAALRAGDLVELIDERLAELEAARLRRQRASVEEREAAAQVQAAGQARRERDELEHARQEGSAETRARASAWQAEAEERAAAARLANAKAAEIEARAALLRAQAERTARPHARTVATSPTAAPAPRSRQSPLARAIAEPVAAEHTPAESRIEQMDREALMAVGRWPPMGPSRDSPFWSPDADWPKDWTLKGFDLASVRGRLGVTQAVLAGQFGVETVDVVRAEAKPREKVRPALQLALKRNREFVPPLGYHVGALSLREPRMGIKSYLPTWAGGDSGSEQEQAESGSDEQSLLGNQEVAARQGAARPAGSYTAKAGDTLGKIAKTATGDPMRYRELNTFNGRDVEDASLEVGMVLSIPPGWDVSALGGGEPPPSPAFVELAVQLLGDEPPDGDVVRALWEALPEADRARVIADRNLHARLDAAVSDDPQSWSEWGWERAGNALDAAQSAHQAVDALDRKINPARWAKDNLVTAAGEVWAAWARPDADEETAVPQPTVTDLAEQAPADDPVARYLRADGPTIRRAEVIARGADGKATTGEDGEARRENRAIEGGMATLGLAQTRADLGDSGTHYKRTFAQTEAGKKEQKAVLGSHTTGATDADTFWCSGLSVWTLAASGIDMNKPLMGSDDVPYTYTEGSESRPRETQISLKSIVDGQPESVEAIKIIQDTNMTKGGTVGRLKNTGYQTEGAFVDGDDHAAVTGAAGMFELTGLGARVADEERKPGDFAQSRYKTNVKDSDGKIIDPLVTYRGAGHAWQVWSIKVKGAAMFGREGSPEATDGASRTGWQEGVEFWLDGEVDPSLVGAYQGKSEVRIEANIAGAAGTDLARGKNGGDGGVAITGEKPWTEGPGANGYEVYYGRLGGSPWSGWSPARRSQFETAQEKPDAEQESGEHDEEKSSWWPF